MAIQPQPSESTGRERPAHARTRTGRAIENASNGATDADERLAKGLGWFSIGLGVAETLVPGGVARLAGVPRRRGVLRTFGMREIGSGVGILSERRPVMWLWSRVAGDVLDLTALAAAFTSRHARRGRLVAATAAVAGVTALDVLCARRLSRGNGAATQDTSDGVRVRTSITISRSADEIYRFWRDFTNLPRVMHHLEAVQARGERRSHWVARLPVGSRVEWDAEIVDDRPGQLIAWRSLPGGDVETEGTVRFVPAPGSRGTEVHLDMVYRVSGGLLTGGTMGRLFGGTASAFVSEDLRPLKQFLETGEIPTAEGSPSARTGETAGGEDRS